jgi:hypothetical protein
MAALVAPPAGLTSMSESGPTPEPRARRNCPSTGIFAGLVRFVHGLGIVVLPAVSTRREPWVAACALMVPAAACVVPPDLSIEGDDTPAPNSPPIIVSVADRSGNDFERPGPRSVTIGDDRLAVTVADNDLTDVLTLYFFIDYGLPSPTPRRVSCLAAPSASGERQRTVLCDINTVCLEGEELSNPHVLELEVFDRTPVDTGTPAFRSVPAPGLSTGWWWQINCVEASL